MHPGCAAWWADDADLAPGGAAHRGGAGTAAAPSTAAARGSSLAVGAACACGIALRFGSPGALWLDEAISVDIAQLGPGGILTALRQDGHPPLYYLLLHGWMEVLGDSAGSARALSAVFSIATIPLAWFAGMRLGRSTDRGDRDGADGHVAVRRALRDRGPHVLADGAAEPGGLPRGAPLPSSGRQPVGWPWSRGWPPARS